jgi:putative flippase GtrA
MEWLARCYAKRIINVNVNIIVAGVLALGFTVIIMTLIGKAGLDERIHNASKLSPKFIVGGLTFIVDLVADVAVYFLLHWLANHLPRKSGHLINPAYAKMSFLEDAGRVQVQRACLSPVLYIIALGCQHALLHANYSIAASTAIGFAAGISVTRVLHTAWMWLEERRLAKRHAHTLVPSPSEQRPAA